MGGNFLVTSNSWGISCTVNLGFAQCSGTPGNDNFTLIKCTAGPCDGVKDVTVSDDTSSEDLEDIDTLNIDGSGGDDSYNVDLAFGTFDLDQINLIGQTGSNQLAVWDAFAAPNQVQVEPVSFGGIFSFLNSTALNFADMQIVAYFGRGGNDFITVIGDANNNTFSYQQNDTPDSGTVRVLNIEPKTAISFFDMGPQGQAILEGMGGNNSLSYQSTEGTDVLSLGTLNPDEATIGLVSFLGGHISVRASFIQSIVLELLGGEDFVTINGPFDPANVVVNGGGQSFVDTLSYFGGGSSVEVVPSLLSLQESGGGIISYLGIEQVGLNLAQADLKFTGFLPASQLTYTPTALDEGLLQSDKNETDYFFLAIGNLSLDTAGEPNQSITVPGIPGAQLVEINQSLGMPRVEIQGLLPAELIGFEVLNVYGEADDDIFNVSPLDDTTVVVDGGPHGLGDTFNFDGLGLDASVRSSSISSSGKRSVAYFNMENVNIENVNFGTPPPGGLVEFGNAVFRNFQNDEFAVIPVNRSGIGVGAVSVDFTTSDQTAVAGQDYEATSGTLNWANGETGTKTFKIPIIDQDLPDGFKTVNLTLSNLMTSGGAQLGELSAGTLMILGGEAPTTTNTDSEASGNGCILGKSSSHSPILILLVMPILILARLRFFRFGK